MTTWRRDKAAADDLSARMDVCALLAGLRDGIEVPEGTEPRLWFAVETLFLMGLAHPETLAFLLGAVQPEVLEGASHRLVRKSELFLLLHFPRKSPGPKPEKGKQI